VKPSSFLLPNTAALFPDFADLQEAATAARSCHRCPLWERATQTVFGSGPKDARILFVGEQPGDMEDREGAPFVGPAGKLLDRALADARIDRNLCYVSNAVKHFKWEPLGKRRLHKKPTSREIQACRPWLEVEVALIHPEILVALGATAAASIFGRPVRIGDLRSKVTKAESFATDCLVTVHPSSILRALEPEDRDREFERLVEDLRLLKPFV
jgi:uracil-DNA glycosylase